MQTVHNFHHTFANPPSVADNARLYRDVAQAIARQSDHLIELVRLLTEIQRRGVDLSEHWDCLEEALVFDELN